VYIVRFFPLCTRSGLDFVSNCLSENGSIRVQTPMSACFNFSIDKVWILA